MNLRIELSKITFENKVYFYYNQGMTSTSDATSCTGG